MHVSESEYISMRLCSHISNIQFHIYRSDIQDVSDTIKKKKIPQPKIPTLSVTPHVALNKALHLWKPKL